MTNLVPKPRLLLARIGCRFVGRGVLNSAKAAFALVVSTHIVASESVAATAELEFFERQIRPVLAEHCYDCHSDAAGKLKAGLRVDSREALLLGGDSGSALAPGDPEQSLLIRAVQYDDVDLQMPPNGRLDTAVVRDLRRWVRMGAPWTTSPVAESGDAAAASEFDLDERRRSHWSWQPVVPQPLPAVEQEGRVRQPIDRFLQARLESAGLEPASRADRRTRIRRLYLDLIGLPPSPAVVERFAEESSPDAWAHEVDRLLALPHFGERWARHWLDLVRYADTLGHEFDYPTPNAWQYRDYLIRAFNADVPYDQFAREHLAGDLLREPRRHPESGLNESLIGTSFYWFGQRVHSPVDAKQNEADIIDNQIDVLSKSFLGLTVACARCHDHKFDAISTQDYYAFYGVLASSRYLQRSIEPPGRHRDVLNKLRMNLRALEKTLEKERPQPAKRLPASLVPKVDPTTVLADFTLSDYEGWFLEGDAFGCAPAPTGAAVVLSSNRVAILDTPAAHSAALARRLQGALLSPSFVISNRFLHIEAAGRDSRFNVVVQNHTLIRNPIYGSLKRKLDHDEFRWITLDLNMWQGLRAYLEFSDLATPDLADDGHRQGFDLAGYLAVRRAILSDEREVPKTYTRTALRVVEVAPNTEAAQLLENHRHWENQLGDSTRVPSMIDGNGLDEAIFIRGNPRNPGAPAPRAFLEALSGAGNRFTAAGSGRRELADRVADPDNPFFARVYVNRVWHHLFGQGLVSTPDDWGVLGRPPSHPELLDWLADWFRNEGGWSTKALVRLLVTSDAYQRSSRPSNSLAETLDPTNQLWHRMPIRRLEGEIIRDAILAVSGRLDLQLYGPPVAVHLTSFMEGRGRPERSGPLDGAGRRSVYLEIRRNFLSPMMRTFDAPVPFTTIGNRTDSNVPAQSLILLNDPFVEREARRWAERLLTNVSSSTEQRLAILYREGFGRAPTPRELRQCQEFLESQRVLLTGAGTDLQAWADLCHVLFNVKEFIYVH